MPTRASRIASRLVDALDRRFFAVVLVLDLADDLLEQILDRDEAGRAAVLVDDDGDVHLALAQLGQQLVDALRLRDEVGRARDLASAAGGDPR